MKKNYNNKGHSVRHAIVIGIWTFFLAALASFVSQTLVGEITFVVFAFILLLIVILVGVIFDIIGVAVTAANAPPLHARAAEKIFGAKQAVALLINAHHVASFCNDVVGDITGTLSGAIGVAIIFKILKNSSDLSLIVGTTIITALVAALVVGGKAYGKSFAIREGTTIIFRVGQLIAYLERFLPFALVRSQKSRRSDGSRFRQEISKSQDSKRKNNLS